ncbi:flagellar biosynthesis protein FlgF [Rhodobacterales bacterium LSUCC0031]|nr:flagellar biosynthesis protein FlgF [Rhodobacterales bacterium LSUCC0031]
MDRMIHTALNSMRNLAELQKVNAQNLTNMTVPGFRKDLWGQSGTGYLQAGDTPTTRAFALTTGESEFSNQHGVMDPTGIETDVAILDDGWFLVQPPDGSPPALSRRGDLSLNADGILINGSNETVLSDGLAPIQIPPYREIQITQLGEILINPLAAEVGQFVSVGFIGTTTAAGVELRKGEDARIRAVDGTIPAPDQLAHLQQGMLEGSNVNAVEELVYTIELQRRFEMSVKFIESARQIDQAAAQIMRIAQE